MKSKKTIESFIGKMIFGSLMALPLIAIASTTLYTICNKNAYQSYTETSSATINNYQNNATITAGNYILAQYNGGTPANVGYYTILDNKTDLFKYNIPTTKTITAVQIINNSNETQLNIFTTENNVTQNYSVKNWQNIDNQFYFIFGGNGNNTLDQTKYVTFSFVSYTNDTLDNAIYYSIKKVEQSNLFNWVEETATYTVIHNTTNAIQINMPILDLLLTYWLMITLIYIIFDIVYVMLMLAHEKIHGLIEK